MKPCKRRKTVMMFEADGSKTDTFQCAERTAPMHTLPVIEADCDACPVRDNVNKMELDRAARKTSNLRGFVRQSKDTEATAYPACDHREVATVRACCGEEMEIRVCDHRASSRYQSEVTPVICEQCPYKK